jgi:DNA-directed RNA polymerase specialized sigma24 family protein
MEDEKIIDLYWNRDQGAIGHTAEKYGSYCGRIAKNILLNKEDCEECVNDTWLRAKRELRTYMEDHNYDLS